MVPRPCILWEDHIGEPVVSQWVSRNYILVHTLVKLLIKRVRLASMSTRIIRMSTGKILCVFALIHVL